MFVYAAVQAILWSRSARCGQTVVLSLCPHVYVFPAEILEELAPRRRTTSIHQFYVVEAHRKGAATPRDLKTISKDQKNQKDPL